MSLSKELQIHKDCCVLLHYVDVAVVNMSRNHKYNIGNRMFDYVLNMREDISHANRISGQARRDSLNHLLEMNDGLDVLNTYCLEHHYLSLKQSSQIAEYIEKIGKQATAWRNSIKMER